jgi:hypothetical protein
MKRSKTLNLTAARCRELFTYSGDGKLRCLATGIFKGSISRNKGKYPTVTVDGVQVSLHNVVWLLFNDELPEAIDHVNGDKYDNRPENLRAADKQRNEANTGPRRNNKTGFKGVRLHSQNGIYTAQVNVGKTQIYLSSEKTPEDAAMVYNWAAYEWYGPYAKLNTVPQPWLEEV